MKWRKWNRIIHRDIGYIFFGMSIVYGLSGIALNHIQDWNPDYIIKTRTVSVSSPGRLAEASATELRELLQGIDEDLVYKSHYSPQPGYVKIFLRSGSLIINTGSGEGRMELLKKRPVFFEVNFLHYNKPKKLWTWFSDAFGLALILLAISGLFMIKGRKGITGRGAWLTAAGIIIPLLFLIIHLW
jgi:hypothetical protein